MRLFIDKHRWIRKYGHKRPALQSACKIGGAKRDRTADLLNAIISTLFYRCNYLILCNLSSIKTNKSFWVRVRANALFKQCLYISTNERGIMLYF